MRAGPRRPPTGLCLALSAAGSVLAYVLAARLLTDELGFPLDDAWIHQTLARSLSAHGELALTPGHSAALSSSLPWTLLLAAGYRLGVPGLGWALALGALSTAAGTYATWRLGRAVFPGSSVVAGIAAAGTVLDWRLVWLGASGMETALFTAACTAALWSVVDEQPPFWQGVACGIAAALRPEGSALAMLALLSALRAGTGRDRLRRAGALALPVLALAAPVALANVWLGGTPLPATAMAKIAMFAQPAGLAGRLRFLGLSGVTWLSGPSLFVLVGLAGWLPPTNKGRSPKPEARSLVTPSVRGEADPGRLALDFTRGATRHVWVLVAWPAALVALYAWRLPALIQYGRYVLPALPALLVLGAIGGMRMWRALPLRRPARVYAMLAVVGSALLWANGAWRYAQDVQWATDEQVAAARWIAVHTPEDAVIATHDIGAISYFGQRPVRDTAGLADAAALPLLRDDAALLAWARSSGATYVAYFPVWYPHWGSSDEMEVVWRPARSHAAALAFPDFIVAQLR